MPQTVNIVLFCSWPWISNLVYDFFCSFGLDWRWLNVILCFYQSYFYVICMICNLFFWVLLSFFTQCVELTPFYACHHIPTLWQDQMMRAMREQWVPFYHHFFVWLLALRLFFLGLCFVGWWRLRLLFCHLAEQDILDGCICFVYIRYWYIWDCKNTWFLFGPGDMEYLQSSFHRVSSRI